MVEGTSDVPADSAATLCWGAATDVGKVRDENQDAFFVDAAKGLFLVSDGMGGHQGGALASKIVATVLPQMLAERFSQTPYPSTRSLNNWLKADVLGLSRRLRTESLGRPDLHGMGATLVMAVIRHSKAHILHMGDSRAYLLRDGRLKLLTQDHSIVGILLRQGDITEEQAQKHPSRGQLSRYLGMEAESRPDIQTIDVKPADRLLLCTDGLTNILPDAAIAQIVSAHRGAQAACDVLVAAANEAGGKDNVTVVVSDWR